MVQGTGTQPKMLGFELGAGTGSSSADSDRPRHGNPAGDRSGIWADNAALEGILEKEHESNYLIVMLGRKPEEMQRVANQMQHITENGNLAAAMPGYSSHTKVLIAADVVHAWQLWQEHGYHQVCAIFVHPDDESGEQLVSTNNLLDHYRVTQVNRERVLTGSGVDESAVATQVLASLKHHQSAIEVVKESYGGSEAVLPSGLLTLQRVQRNNAELEDIISTRAQPVTRDAWAARKREEVINTKRVQPSRAPPKLPSRKPTTDETTAALMAVTQYKFPPINEADYEKRTGPSDSRRASPELGALVETIMAAAAHGQTSGMTRLTQHATRGITGLFPPEVQAGGPDARFYFVKSFNSEAEVEALFRDGKRLRDRGVVVSHQPLAYHYIPETEEFAVVSSSPLLAITAKVAEQVRVLSVQLNQPSLVDGYLDALMRINLKLLIDYKRIAGTPTTEADMALALHRYKATERTGVQDLQMATGAILTALEETAFIASLGIFDDLSLWNPKLFGPLMDNKTYNHGHNMGTIEPTPEHIRAILFRGALTSDGSLNGAAGQKALELNMIATYSILEYATRLGVVWEDNFHTVNSPDLNIPPQKKPAYLRMFMQLLMPEATETDCKGIWPAYFAMERFKALRKMQRTIHYIITSARSEEDSAEGASMQKRYLTEYKAYRDQLVRTTFAVTQLLTHHAGDRFDEQLYVLGQLYAEKNPQFPQHPESLPPVPRALYGGYLALRRLTEEPPKPRLLKSLDIVR